LDFRSTFTWASTVRVSTPNADTMVMTLLPPFRRRDPHAAFPSSATATFHGSAPEYSSPSAVSSSIPSAFFHATKQRRNASPSSFAKMYPNWPCVGTPCRYGKNWRRTWSFSLP
jgi:hypothetical protein